jgi:Probable sensor domain DACNV
MPSESGIHAYPRDLARIVQLRWQAVQAQSQRRELPEPRLVEEVISICYQASLLQEEGRSVTFRVGFGSPDDFAGPDPLAGLYRLVFARPRPLDEHELRRLAPAAAFSRSLIGATLGRFAGPEIWGVIHSGPEWLTSATGGQPTTADFSHVLIVAATGPGRLLVSAGATTLAVLSNGLVTGGGMDVFDAPWMREVFSHMAGVQWASHIEGRQRAAEGWATVNAAFGPALAAHVLRRILATVRSARHGGTLIIVPESRAEQVMREGRHVTLKYEFLDETPRQRILALTIEIMNELARLHGPPADQSTVGWREYDATHLKPLLEMDQALFDVAHLVADLTHVDGAVLMTNRLELLGFGGEIAGGLPEVSMVARARNLAGTERDHVRTDRVGTRHRSAYRLCQEIRDALAIVVSQDGGLRFIRWQDDAVTYWDQVATAPFEV